METFSDFTRRFNVFLPAQYEEWLPNHNGMQPCASAVSETKLWFWVSVQLRHADGLLGFLLYMDIEGMSCYAALHQNIMEPRIWKQHRSSMVIPSSLPKPEIQVEVQHYPSGNMDFPLHRFSQNIISDKNTENPSIFSPQLHFPPSASYSRMIPSPPSSHEPRTQEFRSAPSHSRPLSQPTIFLLDSLPTLSPTAYGEPVSSSHSDPIAGDFSKQELDCPSNAVHLPSTVSSGLSNRVTPNGTSAVVHSSSQLIPINSHGNLIGPAAGSFGFRLDETIQSAKRKSCCEKDGGIKTEKDVVDVNELVTTYMHLENICSLNSSGTGDKDTADCNGATGRVSSDNGEESSMNQNPNGVQGQRGRGCQGDGIAQVARYFRSVSMDSCIGNMHLSNESPLPSPSLQSQWEQKFQITSSNGNIDGIKLDLGNGVFSAAELDRIMASERLTEIASSDPRRAKRILANRRSAARSKERKMQYTSELENKVQTLQTEATTLSTQVTLLHRDNAEITCRNNELKLHIQAMEQKARIDDALNERLRVEIQCLRLSAAGFEASPPNQICKAAAAEVSKWQQRR